MTLPLRDNDIHAGALPPVFGRYHADIDAELRSLVGERVVSRVQEPASLLYDMMRYHFGWVDAEGRICSGRSGGKAVRPTLCLMASEACGGDYRRALPAAAAVELVHNYSLIHDDIQDDDRERRHRPTVWSIWGKPQAINAGTAMRMLANVAIRRLDIPAFQQARIQSLLDEATIRLIEGQHLDIGYEDRLDITGDDYFTMVGGKTAALIACALEIGAVLATDDGLQISAFRDLGWNLGMAFQTRDDILGIWGEPEDTGKPRGSDIIRRKKTFPIVYGLEKASGDLREHLVRVYSNGTLNEEAVAVVMAALERIGARDAAQKMAEGFAGKAAQALDQLRIIPPVKRAFGDIISFVAVRTF
jgi:geranylgeranyl diphosphate synthase type I